MFFGMDLRFVGVPLKVGIRFVKIDLFDIYVCQQRVNLNKMPKNYVLLI